MGDKKQLMEVVGHRLPHKVSFWFPYDRWYYTTIFPNVTNKPIGVSFSRQNNADRFLGIC